MTIVIYDNIHGGMGLVGDLYRDIEWYARNLNVGIDNEPGMVYPQCASRLVQWLEQGGKTASAGPTEPGAGNWWRVVRSSSRVRAFSERRTAVLDGVVEKCEWRNGIFYLVDLANEPTLLEENRLEPVGSSFDWELWQPSTNKYQELQFTR